MSARARLIGLAFAATFAAAPQAAAERLITALSTSRVFSTGG